MPPSKRKPRRKAADIDTSEVDGLDSSPLRQSSAKKRKINGTRSSTRRKTVSPEPAPSNQMDDSGDESETVSQSDLIDSVVSYLQVAKEPVMATTEHANEKEQQENVQKVSAYAKIAGRDWTYFVREQSVNIGRPPDNAKEANGIHAAASSPVADMKEVLPVHIDLGPSKIVSRHHSSIFYDGEYPEGGGWHIRVNGRNGVRVNNALLKRGNRMQLKSGAILEIAGTQMMFVTPGDKAQIDQSFIDRAKALATGEEFPNIANSHLDQDSEQNGSYPTSGYMAQGNLQSLAPAPPNFQRARTPPQHSSDGRDQRGVFDSKPAQPGMYARGLMMETTQEIDYSRDAARDLKPPYSYATMIAQAIFSSEEEKLTLSNIYAYIVDKFAFYRHSNSGWQNSIRHNLSLNKAFQKVPRRTDEPGKGMKWQIAPEYRQEYWKKQARKGASSAPSSPASGKEVNPNFRGPNGQNLGYDTTMVSQFSAKDMSDRPVPPPPAKMHFNPGQPQIYDPSQPGGSASTPQRRRTDTLDTLDSPISPYHSHHGPAQPTPGRLPAYTLPSSVPRPRQSPTNPTLSSSYLDTPFPTSQSHQWPMNTPAPLRQNPRLAPPSTLVAPSKFMPDSSPGGPSSFWKQLGVLGTPGTANRGVDISPLKTDMDAAGLGRHDVMSSSPPPMESHNSPSKMASSSQRINGHSFSAAGGGRPLEVSQQQPQKNSTAPKVEEQGANGASSNGNGNHGGGGGISVLPSGPVSVPVAKTEENMEDSDDDGPDGGGFDLARGFAPIGAKTAPAAAAQMQ